MNKWIAEFDLEDGDTMPEHMDLNYKGVKIDFHCKPLEKEPCEDAVSREEVWGMITSGKYPNENDEQFMDRLVEELEDMPPVAPTQKWIPVSERLPKHGGRYLISVFDGINRRTTIAPYLPRSKAWTMVGRRAYWKVIAWMPLPEPYEAESEE